MRPLLLLLVAVLVAGCAAEVPGRPTAATETPLPSRPREVRLDGVDPCSLLTPQQRAELGFTSEPSASRPYVALFRGEVPTCTLSGTSAGSLILGIGAVTTAGIERWREADLAVRIRPTFVAQYPAVITQPANSTNYCGAEVDVAAGQLLDVQVLDGGGTPPTPQADLCRQAERAAEQMMKTLLVR